MIVIPIWPGLCPLVNESRPESTLSIVEERSREKEDGITGKCSLACAADDGVELGFLPFKDFILRRPNNMAQLRVR